MKQALTWSHPSVVRLLKENNSNDPVLTIREKTRDLVSRAFDAGWSGPPFDPLRLAEMLSLEVLPNDAISEAQLVPVPKREARIEYNPHQKPSRIRFSISHEIGHTLFSDYEAAVRHRLTKKDQHSWELEFLCDIAASEILLPYGVFANEAREVPPKMKALMLLADRYGASLEPALLRFAETSDRPCSVMFAHFERADPTPLVVSYSKSSPTFDPKLPRGFVIPKSSKAYECVNPGWTSHGRERWKTFDDDYEVECVGLPAVKYDNRQRVGILVSPCGTLSESSLFAFGDATQPRGPGAKIIAQLVNSGAALGTGFGRAMAEAWPESARALREWKNEGESFALGRSRLTKLASDVYVLQMLAQRGVSSKIGKAGIRYSSLRACLGELGRISTELEASVHMPRIGAGQAGGDWDTIEGMIMEELVAKEVEVTIYDLPGTITTKHTHRQQPLFNLA
jgi:IrrE N-terminal-like domain